ncbi:hypothetical protein ACOME3_006709 [Neoechinorhynchus agilis]
MGTCGSRHRKRSADLAAESVDVSLISPVKEEPRDYYDEAAVFSSNTNESNALDSSQPNTPVVMSDTKLVRTTTATSSLDMVTIPDPVEPVPGSVPAHYQGISLSDALRAARVAFYSGLHIRLMPTAQQFGKYDVHVSHGGIKHDNFRVQVDGTEKVEERMFRSLSTGNHGIYCKKEYDGEVQNEHNSPSLFGKSATFARTISATPVVPERSRTMRASSMPTEAIQNEIKINGGKRRFSVFRSFTLRMRRKRQSSSIAKSTIDYNGCLKSTTDTQTDLMDGLDATLKNENDSDHNETDHKYRNLSRLVDIIRENNNLRFDETDTFNDADPSVPDYPNDELQSWRFTEAMSRICDQINSLPAFTSTESGIADDIKGLNGHLDFSNDSSVERQETGENLSQSLNHW